MLKIQEPCVWRDGELDPERSRRFRTRFDIHGLERLSLWLQQLLELSDGGQRLQVEEQTPIQHRSLHASSEAFGFCRTGSYSPASLRTF